MRKLVLLTPVLAAGLLLLPATAANARPWTADDQDPDANGCAYVDDLARLSQVPLEGPVEGYVQSLASPTCGVVYTRLVLANPDPSLTVTLEVDRWGTAGTFTTHESADGTAFWSNEIGAAPGYDCIHSTADVFDASGQIVASASLSHSCPPGY